VHDANDILVFIQHMYHKNNIEIKIHNDLIQMLNDVNEINILLKTQLKIQQTSLQKEIKNKNVIIHHLKFFTRSRSDSSVSED